MKHPQKTPPIQWLPVFLAAAENLSFKLAAEELHVTPSAVGQKIRLLENWLNTELFKREPRSLSLTKEGKFYLTVARRVMAEYHKGYQEFTQLVNNSPFHLSSSLLVAQELLIPNYLSFSDFLPDTELCIDTRMSLVDFDKDNIDAAIRFGEGPWPRTEATKLCDVRAAPVCSPEYLRQNPIDSMSELRHHRLIYSSHELLDWQFLLDAPADKKLICDSYMNALKAASEGLGVALGFFPITNSWINNNALQIAVGKPVPTTWSYWACRATTNQHPAYDKFVAWAKQLFETIPVRST